MPRWRWTRTASSWPCASTPTPTSAPTCRPSRPRCPPSSTRRCWPGQYTTPQIYVEVDAWFTNTAPVDAYRGAGRPEATYLLERLVSRCAWEMGLGQDEIRKRNFITTFPYQTPVALQYDTGDFHACMDKAKALAEVDGFAARKAASEAQGKLRGIGYSSYIEACGIAPSNIAGCARCARRPVRVRRDPRASDRQRHGVHRLAQPRPGPRNHLRAGGGGAPGHPGGERRRGARRHRPRAVRHGHLRLALDLGRRRGHHEGAGQDRGQGQEDRGPPDGGERCRHRVRQRRVHREGHRQEDPVRPGGAHGLRAAQLPAGQAGAGPERNRVLRPDQLHLPGRHLHLRGGDRQADRRGQDRPLHRGRRLRHHHQPDDRRGPGARRASCRASARR